MENNEEKKTELIDSLKTILSVVGNGFTKVDHNFKTIKEQVDTLNSKVESLHNKLEELRGTTTHGLGDVGIKIEGLTEEISKINLVTQYGEQFENLKGITKQN
ncbi:hypothetical protein [Pseudoflavitalea rhizosphaerae]|uniref:hypothetical protein n=1 Tax=Pseudoflavitalea rhizosphaerae TaxID=1884793 RepID=UPI000F8F744C|nr:hypothetical protein [Pseudoflavitalea rhizosphaerae]